jgi:hypothetical protein
MDAITPVPEDSAGSARNIVRNIAMLQELIDCGTQLARAVGRDALRRMEATEPGTDLSAFTARSTLDSATMFFRLSDEVRKCVALQQRLASSTKIPVRSAPMPKPGAGAASVTYLSLPPVSPGSGRPGR